MATASGSAKSETGGEKKRAKTDQIAEFDSAIMAQREKLRKLEAKRSEALKREAERKYKELLEILKSEKLLDVDISVWKTALPEIKKALNI